jgi:CDP-glucose 4,6-dehydratase
MGPDRVFWVDKNVLMTGHTGIKGSWLSLWLQMNGARVTGYALPPPTHPSLFELARVAEGMRSITGDVRDLDHLKRVLATTKPDIVIHMAAQALVRYSYGNPVETYATNVMGTVNLLEACRLSDSVRVVVLVTSDKCYDNREWVWGYREEDPMGGKDPYSGSKGCAELVTSSYRHSFFPEQEYERHGLALASVRAGNIICGGDWAEDRLIPDIMKSLLEDQPVTIRNPGAVRPWQYVLEPLRGYLELAEKLWTHGPEFAGGWNFGPKDEGAKPVSWIVEHLTELWGDRGLWQSDNTQNPPEAQFLKLDCSKARALLGWSPKMKLATTLEWIVDWYRSYQSGADMRERTLAEIAKYETLE